MIDFHCHIDLYPDPKSILDEVEARGTYVLAVTTTPKAWRGTTKLIGQRRRVRAAVGLHPELVAQRHHEVSLLCGLIPETRYVGEVGLDGTAPHRPSIEQQKAVFSRILSECARHGGKVISIHSRGAAREVLDCIESAPSAGVPILHWFSGTQAELARAVELGCWFSVGPAMLRSRKGLELVRAMPIDKLLTETDAPFARDGDEPLRPWQAFDCLDLIGEMKQVSRSEIAKAMMANLRRVAAAVS